MSEYCWTVVIQKVYLSTSGLMPRLSSEHHCLASCQIRVSLRHRYLAVPADITQPEMGYAVLCEHDWQWHREARAGSIVQPKRRLSGLSRNTRCGVPVHGRRVGECPSERVTWNAKPPHASYDVVLPMHGTYNRLFRLLVVRSTVRHYYVQTGRNISFPIRQGTYFVEPNSARRSAKYLRFWAVTVSS